MPDVCARCHEPFVGMPSNPRRCGECGLQKGRPVRERRTRRIGGKRGRNSGKVSQHGKKG
jgi:hypothetical protein